MENRKISKQENKDTKIYSAVEELEKLSKYYKKRKKFKYLKLPFKLYDDVIHKNLFLCLAGIDGLYTKTELEQLYESIFSMNMKKSNFWDTLLGKFESRSFMLYRNIFNDSSFNLSIVTELKEKIEKNEESASKLILNAFHKFEEKQKSQEVHRLYLCDEITRRDKKLGKFKTVYPEVDEEMKKRDETNSGETDTQIYQRVLDRHLSARDNIFITENYEKKYHGDYATFVEGFSKAYMKDRRLKLEKIKKFQKSDLSTL